MELILLAIFVIGFLGISELHNTESFKESRRLDNLDYDELREEQLKSYNERYL